MMDDTSKIPGLVPHDPLRLPRDSTPPSQKKFQDLMRVKDTEDKQKKKKKQKEEINEENKIALRMGAIASDKNVDRATNIKEFSKDKKKVEGSTKKQTQGEKDHEEAVIKMGGVVHQVAEEKPVRVDENNENQVKPAVSSKGGERDFSMDFPKAEINLEKVVQTEKKVAEEAEVKASKEIEKRSEMDKRPLSPSFPVSVLSVPETLFIAASPAVAPSYTFLSSEMLALFERMVGVMTIMQTERKGITEMTVYLGTPEFGSSVFFGSRIVITEFDTAPLSYNIEFFGNERSSSLFERNIGKLKTAFDRGGYRFRVHDIRSSLGPLGREDESEEKEN